MGTKIFSYRAESRARASDKALDDDHHVIDGMRIFQIGPHEHETLSYEISDGKPANERTRKKGAKS